MKKFVAKLLIVSQLLCNFAFAGKIQNEDVKSLSDLTGAGGSAAQLINDSKIYVTANGLNEQLSAAITNGDIGGAPANGINYFSNFKANGTTGFSTCNETQTFTVTIASPAVFTSAASHGFAVGQALTFSTSGVLPTGLTAGTTYYVSAVPSGTTYRVSATLGGADVNTSGSQSGTQTQYPATPITCSSGSLSGLALTASSVSPLRYTSSFLLTQTNSAKVQGQGIAYNYTIANADQAKTINVSFDYNASSTFVASSGQAGATGTSGIDSDLEIYMYDATNAVPIPVSPKVITANGANNYTYKGSFQTNANSTSYRMIIYASTPNANATGWTFKFVNVQISPQQPSSFGAPITDWVPYTPTITGLGTVSAVSFWSRRNAGNLDVSGIFTQGTGTAVANQITLGFNGGNANVTIDSTKVSATMVCGVAAVSVSSAAEYPMLMTGGNNYIQYGFQAAGNAGLTPFVGGSGSGTVLSFHCSVPIAGWGSTTTLSQDSETRIVAASYSTLSSTTLTSGTNIKFTTAVYDTHAGYNTSTGAYTAPISGMYRITMTGVLCPTQDIDLRINGSVFAPAFAGLLNSNKESLFITVPMKAGDAVSLTPNGNNTTSNTGGYFNVERISGPATVATSETVAASYYASTNVGCSASTPVNYDTKIFDTHNAVQTAATSTTGLFRFIAPTSGNYTLGGLLSVTATSGVNWSVFKNGSAYKFIAQPANGTYGIPPNAIIPMLAGDFIDVRPHSSFTCQGGGLSGSGSVFDIHLIK